MKITFKYFNRKHLQLNIGLVLVLIGLLLGGVSIYNLWSSQRSAVKPELLSRVLKNTKPADDGQPLISGTPVRIEVPSVNIDLKVIPGYYYPSTKSWTLSLDKAQYAVMTAKPNNKQGNTFIYGHYRLGVFYTLPKIHLGAETIITTDNGHKFTYTFEKSSITTPEDTSLFNYQGKPILILQTCTGAQFQNRQLFVFNLTRVN